MCGARNCMGAGEWDFSSYEEVGWRSVRVFRSCSFVLFRDMFSLHRAL